MNQDREITKKFVQHAEKRGIKALFITVDAPQLGRREKVRLSSDLLITLRFPRTDIDNATRTCGRSSRRRTPQR